MAECIFQSTKEGFLSGREAAQKKLRPATVTMTECTLQPDGSWLQVFECLDPGEQKHMTKGRRMRLLVKQRAAKRA